MNFKRVPIAKLRKPAQPNSNKMSPADFAALKAAIADPEIGFLQPILCIEYPDETLEIVDGQHRTQACTDLGHTEIDAYVVEVQADWSEARVRAARLAMNRLRGEPDLSVVARELADLAAAGWGLDQLVTSGYSDNEIQELLASVAPPVEPETLTAAGPAPAEPTEGQSYDLVITFENRTEFQRVRRALKRGGDGDPKVGLLKLLDRKD